MGTIVYVDFINRTKVHEPTDLETDDFLSELQYLCNSLGERGSILRRWIDNMSEQEIILAYKITTALYPDVFTWDFANIGKVIMRTRTPAIVD